MKTVQKTIRFIALSIMCFWFLPGTVPAVPVTGTLETINGKRVLKLWGTHYMKGYAHGYLLAEEIVELLDTYMLGELYSTEDYPRTRLLISRMVRVPAVFKRELQGMHDGIVAAVGRDGFYSTALGRTFNRTDLLAWNMAPEIFRLSFDSSPAFGEPCFSSSVSGWGSGTADGELILARDLDFGYPGDLLDRTGIIISYRSASVRKNMVSVAWPGQIGCLTCMNEDGSGVALDLGNNSPSLDDLLLKLGEIYLGIPGYYTPVLLALRRTVEKPRRLRFLRDAIGNFYGRLRRLHFAGSFDILLFSPSKAPGLRSDPPASILECNHLRTVLRTPEHNDRYEPELEKEYFLAVTNHHRKLIPPVDCPRYETQVERLNALDILDMETAFDIERAVAQSRGPFNTVHMVGFNADRLEIWVSFAEGSLSAAEAEPAFFTWDELF